MPNKSKQGVYVTMPVSFFSSFFRDHLLPVDQSTRKNRSLFFGEYSDRLFSNDGVQSSGAAMLSSSESCVVITHMLQTIKPSVIMLSTCIMSMP